MRPTRAAQPQTPQKPTSHPAVKKYRNSENKLRDAVVGNDIEGLHWLLLLKGGPEQQLEAIEESDQKEEPLIVAASRLKLEPILLRLLECTGIDINKRDANGRSALSWAAEQPDGVIQILLDAKSNPNLRDTYEQTPLMAAVHCKQQDNVLLLLNAGASPNAQRFDGVTPLRIAMINRDCVCAQLLIQHNASPNIEDRNGASPLHVACAEGGVRMVETLLLGRADPNTYSQRKGSALLQSIRFGFADIAQLLVQHGAKKSKRQQGLSPLMWALSEDKLDIVEILLHHGAKTSVCDEDGQTLLMKAAEMGKVELVQHLLTLPNVSPDTRNSDGQTALMLACSANEAGVVQTLLNAHASVYNLDDDGDCAFSIAVRLGNNAIVSSLLKAKADPLRRQADGRSALHVAACLGHVGVVESLIAVGAMDGVENAQEARGALLLAVVEGFDDVAIALLNAHVAENVGYRVASKVTLLMVAASEGRSFIARHLLRLNADPNETEANNKTALHFAAAAGSAEVIRALLAAGAHVEARDLEGHDATWYAKKAGSAACAQLLETAACVSAIPTTPGEQQSIALRGSRGVVRRFVAGGENK